MATSPDDLRQCPYCAEKIKKAALVCKHCRSKLTEQSENSTPEPPQTRELVTSLTPRFSKIVPIVVCAVVLIVIGFQVSPGLFEMMKNGTGQPAAQDDASEVPSLAGTWEFAFQSAAEQQPHPGQMQIVQDDSTIQGQGQDQAPFVLQGTFNPPKIMFNKQYVVDGQPKGKPLTFMGQVTFSKDEGPIMEGVFIELVKKGESTQMHYEEIRGKWQAQMVGANTTASPTTR